MEKSFKILGFKIINYYKDSRSKLIYSDINISDLSLKSVRIVLIYERNNVIYDIPYSYNYGMSNNNISNNTSNNIDNTSPSIVSIDGDDLLEYLFKNNVSDFNSKSFEMSTGYHNVFNKIFPVNISYNDIVQYIDSNVNNSCNSDYNKDILEVDLHRNNMLTFTDDSASGSTSRTYNSIDIFRWLNSDLKPESIDLFEKMAIAIGTIIYTNINVITYEPICYSVSVIANEKNLTYFTLGGNPYNEL